MKFGENLREAMNIMGITTKELALKSGLKEETINSYLKKNGATPTADKAVKLANALNTSVEFLVTGFEKKISKDTYEIHKTSKYFQLLDDLNKLPNESRNTIICVLESFVEKYSKK